ncbi:hypothetical protein V7094_27790 [Priestia megaterium]
MTDILLPFVKLLVTLKIIELAVAGVVVVGAVLTFLILFLKSLIKKQKY